MSADKVPPQHPRPVEGDDRATWIGPKDVDQHTWLTEYRPDVPANFTHGAVLLYRDYLTQKSWAASRLAELQASWKRFDAERNEHLLTKAALTYWRVMSGAMALMLFGVWANTYIFGGAA